MLHTPLRLLSSQFKVFAHPRILLLPGLLFFSTAASAMESVLITSPAENLAAEVFVDQTGQLSYEVKFEGKTLIEKSNLGITVDAIDYGSGFSIKSVEESTHDETYRIFGAFSQARNHYNQKTIRLEKGDDFFTLELRAFNDGFAYRYIVDGNETRIVNGEASSWKIIPDSQVWYFERPNWWKLKSYAGYWLKTDVEKLHQVSPGGPIQGPPLVVEIPEQEGYMLISEAATYDYSGMRLKAMPGGVVQANFTEGREGFPVEGTITTPWRVTVMVKDLNGLVNSSVITNLNPAPDEDLFSDVSYIKPGRSVWRWFNLGTGTPEEELRFIDYAAELGFEYTTVDDGWIDWEDNWAEAKKLCDYAQTKSVGVFFWSHSNKLDDPTDDWKQMREFMDNLKEVGSVGMKIDFMNSEAKELIDFEIAVLTKAAERKLLVNFHGCHKSTGEYRRFPNEITREGVRGLELNRMKEGPLTASHNAALPFTRFAVGHADYTPLSYRLPGPTTWAHQLATVVLFTSPLQVIAENPDLLLNDPSVELALDVLKDIPTVWDETLVLDQSKIGELAMFARKSEDKWFFAAINGKEEEDQHIKDVSLSFLDEGVTYKAIILSSDKSLADSEQGFVRQERFDITSKSKIDINMGPADGYTAIFTPFDPSENSTSTETTASIHTIHAEDGIAVKINSNGFRFWLEDKEGRVLAPPHPVSGLQIDGQPVVEASRKDATSGNFSVHTADGRKAEVNITVNQGQVGFEVIPEDRDPHNITLAVGGMPVAHGLGDSAGYHAKSFNLVGNQEKPYHIKNNGGSDRWLSTFLIFPKNNFAGVYFAEGEKSVSLTESEYAMTINTTGSTSFYYFTGDMKSVYKDYLSLRKQYGYPNIKPKFRLFELGWETWDALKYNTSIDAVEEAVGELLKDGYPIRWLVTGSGFWEDGGTTTSFGKFSEKFSDHEGFRSWLDESDIKWLIGFRSNMVPSGGPYSAEKESDGRQKPRVYKGNPLSQYALDSNFFFESSEGEVFKKMSPNYPQVACYVIDGRNPDATKWFVEQYDKWGVDGIKEDTMIDMGDGIEIFNGPSALIAEQGGLVMARSGSFSAPGTLQRINDTFGAVSMQRRIPLNYMQYAASAAPNVYSDTIAYGNINDVASAMRHGWLMATTAGLAMGKNLPDTWSRGEKAMFKKMINFHHALAPYKYDAAMKSYESGYPYTLTPISIAFPSDEGAAKATHYQWMIGESILAAPLVKNYKRGRLDVYLPEGIWYDYDSGKKYQGPVMLENFEMPLDKTPCFIGGKGVIVHRTAEHSPLRVSIYPVLENQTEFSFNYPDGASKSNISLRPLGDVTEVIDSSTGKPVQVETDARTGALSFDIQPGHDYELR